MKSANCRSVTRGSWLLIDGYHFTKDAGKDVFVGFGAEIDLAAKNRGKFILVSEVVQPDTAECARNEFDVNIHIAGFWVEIRAENGPEKAHPPDPPGGAILRDFPVIDDDRKFQNTHGCPLSSR